MEDMQYISNKALQSDDVNTFISIDYNNFEDKTQVAKDVVTETYNFDISEDFFNTSDEDLFNTSDTDDYDWFRDDDSLGSDVVCQSDIDESKPVELCTEFSLELELPNKEVDRAINDGINYGQQTSNLKFSDNSRNGKMRELVDIVTAEAKSGNLKWNIYKENPIFRGKDVEISDIRVDLSCEYNLDIRTEDLRDVIKRIVVKNEKYIYNAVTEYCDSVIEKYGTEINGYIHQFSEILGLLEPIERIFLRKYFIASVARAYEPGCYCDNILIFYGKKGLGKTKTFGVLYGKDYYATLQNDKGDRDILSTCRTHWCTEIGEYERFLYRNQEAEIKSFITKEKDELRQLYTDNSKSTPRRFVLFGTTNKKEILNDIAGDRRYWICEITKKIDRKWVANNRNLIWAEAVAAYRNGEKWYLNETEELAQNLHNDNFTVEDPNENLVIQWVNGLYCAEGGIKWKDSLATEGFTLQSAIQSIFGNKVNTDKAKSKLTPVLRKLDFYDSRKSIGGVRQRLWFHDNIGQLTGKEDIRMLNANYQVDCP